MALSGSLNFVSGSEIGLYRVNPSSVRYGITKKGAIAAGESGFTPVDFAGLNTIIYENLTASSNTLGSTDVSYTLGSDIINLDIKLFPFISTSGFGLLSVLLSLVPLPPAKITMLFFISYLWRN